MSQVRSCLKASLWAFQRDAHAYDAAVALESELFSKLVGKVSGTSTPAAIDPNSAPIFLETDGQSGHALHVLQTMRDVLDSHQRERQAEKTRAPDTGRYEPADLPPATVTTNRDEPKNLDMEGSLHDLLQVHWAG